MNEDKIKDELADVNDLEEYLWLLVAKYYPPEYRDEIEKQIREQMEKSEEDDYFNAFKEAVRVLDL